MVVMMVMKRSSLLLCREVTIYQKKSFQEKLCRVAAMALDKRASLHYNAASSEGKPSGSKANRQR
jgi:chemotaxis methyl-accepting protein methylase